VPLDESPLKDHPLNPMHDANLVRVLQRQSRDPVGLVDLATIAAGPAAVRARLAALQAQGAATAIADAVFERDLEVLGEVAADSPVSTGASGLGLGLARALARSRGTDASPVALEPVGGHAAAVAGSCSKATLEQIAAAEADMPVLRLNPERLAAGDAEGEVAAALAWAAERLAAGPVLVASSGTPEQVQALQRVHGREASGAAIERATAAIAAGLVALGVRRLVVAGGETSGAAVDRLGIPAFLVEQEIAPGVPILQTVGWNGPPMRLALKSGNFGGTDFFRRAIAMMA
jgi:3-dehydrotetronate 4-kinase